MDFEDNRRGDQSNLRALSHAHTDLVNGYLVLLIKRNLAVSTQLGWLDCCWGKSRGGGIRWGSVEFPKLKKDEAL